VARQGSRAVGKKPVIKLLGLSGGGRCSAGLLDGSVDSEKVAGERDVVGGRHCARVIVWWLIGVGLFGGWKVRSGCCWNGERSWWAERQQRWQSVYMCDADAQSVSIMWSSSRNPEVQLCVVCKGSSPRYPARRSPRGARGDSACVRLLL
jgi:hypothetical protein